VLEVPLNIVRLGRATKCLVHSCDASSQITLLEQRPPSRSELDERYPPSGLARRVTRLITNNH
jgi:hypothetical protein